MKTKMEQEQWMQLKMLFLLGYNLQNYYLVCVCMRVCLGGRGGGVLTFGGRGGIKNWWETHFQGYLRNSMQNFQGLIKTTWNFQGRPRKIPVKFPGVLVFELVISEGCNIHNFTKFPVVELCFIWNFQGYREKQNFHFPKEKYWLYVKIAHLHYFHVFYHYHQF